ncbi:MAG TPA: sigma-70 family RNA polymerase sigma factor [Polyangiaceae bacterium]|nr:sigma-70 family RNA polymerase sigma factor [Polyangiaceae bacterium]
MTPRHRELEQLLVDHRTAFLNFITRRLDDTALAEDMLQEAFMRGLSHLDELKTDEALLGWFYRILRHQIIDYYRSRSVGERRLEALAAELAHDPVFTQQEPYATEPSPCRCVVGIVDHLKPEYASALKRVELDGLPVKDYAQEAGISSNNAGVRIHRAREALRKEVVRCCGSCADNGCVDCTCQS